MFVIDETCTVIFIFSNSVTFVHETIVCLKRTDRGIAIY
jgi:hypothetical protein